MKKLFTFLLLGLFVISIVSAIEIQQREKVGYDWDNVKQFKIDESTSKYGKYEIRNSIAKIPFLSLSKVADIELINNSDICGIDCFAEKEITLYNDGILIDEITFETLQEDGSWKLQNIRSHKFSYQGEIQDYKTECVDLKELNENGTITKTCSQVENGTHIGTIYYNEGDVVKAGTYLLRLDGEKKPSRTVDWKVKTNGIWTSAWTVWGSGEDISTGLVSQYVFNNANQTTLNDSAGSNDGTWSGYTFNDGTISGATLNTTDGKFDNAYDFDGVNDYINTTFINDFPIATTNTISAWIKLNNITSAGGGIWSSTSSSTKYYELETYNDEIRLNMRDDDSGGASVTTAVNLIKDTWYHVVGVRNGDDFEIFIDGISRKTQTVTGQTNFISHDEMRIGSRGGDYFFDGSIDDVRIYNRSLSEDEIAVLYNSGSGTEETSSGGVTLNSPVDDYIVLANPQTFNCSAEITGGATIVNMSLWTNESGTWEMTKTDENIISSEYFIIINADNVIGGTADVVVTSLGSNRFKINATNGDYEIDRALVMKWLFYGTTGSDPRATSTYITNPISIKTNETRDIGKKGIYVYGTASSAQGTYTGTFSDTATNTYVSSWSKVLESYSDGGTYARYEMPSGSVLNNIDTNPGEVDELGTNKVADQKNNPATLQLDMDEDYGGKSVYVKVILLTNGNISFVNSGLSSYGNTDFYINESFPIFSSYNSFVTTISTTMTDTTLWTCQACDSDGDCGFALENRTVFLDRVAPTTEISTPNGTLDYGVIGGNETLNVTFTDDNLDSCWYNYNGTNITIDGCLTGVSNATNFTLEDGNTNMTIYSNDSLGNENSTFISWDYNILENSQTYETPVYETQITEFVINITYDNTASLSAIFNYNGSNYSSTNKGVGNNAIISVPDFNVPLVNDTINKTFYWILNYNDTTIITNELNQTIKPLIINACNSTYNITSLNFTFYEEINQTILNGTTNPTTFLMNLYYWVGDGSIKKQYPYRNASSNFNSYAFCIGDNITYYIDADIQYFATDFSERTYYFRNHTISNQTQNITLYNLLITEATKFSINLKQDTNVFTDAIVNMWKYFVGIGDYRVVMIGLTDDKGKFTANLDLDQTYNITVSRDNFDYNSFIKQSSCVSSPCEIDINIGEIVLSGFADLEEYFAQYIEITPEDEWNNKTAKTISVDFLDTLGTSNYWRLYVYMPMYDSEDIVDICDVKTYSSAGNLFCNYTNYSGDIVAKLYISRSPEKLVEFINFVNNNAPEIFGVSAILASVIIILVIFFAGAKNPAIALVLIPFALVILKFIGFIPLDWSWIAGLSVFILWIAHKVNT